MGYLTDHTVRPWRKPSGHKETTNIMGYGLTETKACEGRVQDAVGRAFLTAHLLTGNAVGAENAVMEALGSWDPGEESADVLLERAVSKAATQLDMGCATPDPQQPRWGVPTELQAVLRLPARLRHCYVLRILAGFSRESCAQMLDLHCQQVDQYTRAAMQCLPLLQDCSGGGIEYLVWKRRMDWTD